MKKADRYPDLQDYTASVFTVFITRTLDFGFTAVDITDEKNRHALNPLHISGHNMYHQFNINKF